MRSIFELKQNTEATVLAASYVINKLRESMPFDKSTEPIALLNDHVLFIKNKSHSVTAEITVVGGGAKGVLVSQGANIGGWSLYFNEGKFKYCYNYGGFQNFFVESAAALAPGDHQVRMEFAYAGGGLGKGGKVTLFVDGQKVGEGNVAATLAIVYSADDGLDVGEDSGAPVSPDYGWNGNAFNGIIKGRALEIGEGAESSEHLIKPERVLAAAMGRQ